MSTTFYGYKSEYWEYDLSGHTWCTLLCTNGHSMCD